MFRISRFFKRVSLCVACVSFLAASPALAGDADPYWEGRKWEPWTEIGGYASNRSYARRGELALWAPFMQDRDSLFFVDLRGKLFAEDQEEGNAAIGYRFMRHDGWNPGFWIGLDRRNTESGTNFDQAAFGVEALSADWDLRLNGYVPLNDRELVSSATSGGTATVEVIGSSIFFVSGGSTTTDLYEIAMWGVDAEVGWRVPLERFGYDPTWGLSLKDGEDAHSGRHHALRLYAGGFYFDHADFDGEVAGPRARAEWQIENIFEDWDGSRLTFETAWQHDDVRDHQIEGGVRLRVPFGAGGDGLSRHALNAQERRMTEGLKRDTDIVSQSQTVVTESGGGADSEPELVEDAETGVDFDTVVTVANGDNLQTAVTTADQNALIIALGGDNDFGAVTMEDNQTLVGGGGSIQVRGRTSGTVATYTAPGSRPKLVIGGVNIVVPAANSHISGVNITGDGDSDAVFITGTNRTVLIDDTNISNVADYGVWVFGDNIDLTVRNSVIEQLGYGVVVTGSGNRINLDGNTIDVSNIGFYLASDADISLANTRFEGTPSHSIIFFQGGTHTVAAGSTGNVNATDNHADECVLLGGATFTGTLGFDTGDFSQGNC